MTRIATGLLIAAILGLTGCAQMEQYHFPQTQDKVPVKVIVAYSEEHPNQVITSISEEKMFDGSVRYVFVITDSKNVVQTVTYSADGKAL